MGGEYRGVRYGNRIEHCTAKISPLGGHRLGEHRAGGIRGRLGRGPRAGRRRHTVAHDCDECAADRSDTHRILVDRVAKTAI
jgi:hypothetical protein